jgi:acyl-CoA thioester hydrolase
MAREQFAFRHTLRVRWAEVDRQGIVFNGNYFLYFDVAITEYWRAIGIDYPDGFIKAFGTDMYAVKATAEYHGSAEFDDILDIYGRTARLGRSSMQFLLEIWRADTHLVSGELIYVNADPATKKAVPLPEPLRQKISAYERLIPLTGVEQPPSSL